MSNDKELAAVIGSLLERLLGRTGLWGPDIPGTAEEWLKGCRIPAPVVRDWLRDIVQDYGLTLEEMGLDHDQAVGLGLPEVFGGVTRGMLGGVNKVKRHPKAVRDQLKAERDAKRNETQTVRTVGKRGEA